MRGAPAPVENPAKNMEETDLTNILTMHRRIFLAGTAGSLAAAGLAGSSPFAVADEAKPLPDYVSWKNPEALIVHSDKTLETRRGAIGTSIITPDSRLYIRNNAGVPDASIVADREAWQLEVLGVKNPRAVTLAELKKMGVQTTATVLQCSGNGRAFFDHKPSGTQWTVGAAGCVIWSGVPLAAVVEAMGGPAGGAKFVTGTGGDPIPEGLDPKDVLVERSVPISMLDDVLLAWEMNGEPLSLAHGGPLRMVVPGFTGVNNVKYVKRVALTENETDARIQASRYRITPVGEKATPQHPSVWEMQVKSWITSPLDAVSAGRMVITGVAFGGMNAVSGVEVSADGGQSWQKAAFIGPDLGRFAWRQFALVTDLAPGTYNLVSRASDAGGNVQPRDFEPNNSGYSHNGWLAHGIDVTVA